MTKKIRKLQIFRHIMQLILFFLLPGMYILAFSELKSIFQMIAKGDFEFIQAFPGLMEFTITIIFTILIGRFFCGWFCAFGTFNDWIHIISKKVFKVNFRINEKIDSMLKYVKYVILFFILFLTLKGGDTILNGLSPWDAFAQMGKFSTVITSMTVGFILLVLIVVGDIFVERFFCRYLCPLGAVFSLTSRISLLKINKLNDKCGKCRMCTNNCSMGLKLYSMNSIRGGECINCLKCVEVCPRKNPCVNIMDKDVNPSMASSFAIAIFAGIYGLTNFGNSIITKAGIASTNSVVSNNVNTADTSQNSVSTSQNTKYKDGTYTGSGTGFNGGTTKVSVTVNGGKITDIKTVSTDDTPRFYQYAESTIPNEIISSQSSSVDTVSGATYSSRGIIEAVQNALDNAK
ncbi:MAG: 4Fe-4S binding protein [Clostridium tyrobutyricum]|uniref:FMN-binding protein n=2 Tax=Clostridium tyrobutyricum TaxID=1519 RepID=UPI00242DFCCF|nr:4Fe-4S binding protein [Clostridium tyrobutyricum]MCH4201162.1 4Fe-4S binding protein [Clostridium tyrobutyricum]MCH4258613.1 4Fe-4S binding protein [Clostridium tyrobutyricum]MCI1239363.1 4Fe-4S binding protein [Clostridium tyrobutyricum]MCI1937125.1 4Fe-4S binding protein [Clostridium tyrobutyricum]MCI1993069.1 4Fe-4S binding protein [Clostridium tyrobutyricum]